MPKKTENVKQGNDLRITQYLTQYKEWRTDLERYWPEMDKWAEMYEFYKSKSERSETGNNISLNTPFAIIESQIAKENQATMSVTIKAKPDNDIGKFDDWIASVLKDAILDPDIAEIHGTFRKIKEKWSRSLKVVGNAVAEINYCYKTQVLNGKKKVIADNPYTKNRHFKSIIFNPAMQFDNSDIYYVEDYVNLKDLTSQEYKEEKDGSTKGIYKNLGELTLALKKTDGKLTDDTSVSYISGDIKINRKNKPIQIITRWEGTKMTVLANLGNDEGIIIREEIDPLKLGGHNLILGMRYCIEGRPYAYGEIAPIYKPVRAQDTVVNQSIEIVNKYLRGSYILGTGIDIDQFMLVLANGGAMEGDVNSVHNVPVNTPPAGAFQTIDVLQQAIERAARFSLYGAGLSGQSTDQTKGTASGIQSIQQAAEPNVETQLEDVQEMFMNPIGRKYLKMIGNLMGADEIRYGLLEGESVEWVRATKNMLMGQATMQDLVTVELLTPEEALQYTTMMTPVLDQMGQPVIDPMTGQPAVQQTPIPGADKALVFDVDWLVDIKLDNQSASDKKEKANLETTHIQWGISLGIPIDTKKAWIQLGKSKGMEDIEDLLLTQSDMQSMPQGMPGQPMPQGMPTQVQPQPPMPA